MTLLCWTKSGNSCCHLQLAKVCGVILNLVSLQDSFKAFPHVGWKILHTDCHRALSRVTVGDEFIQCHSKRPNIRSKIELALSQTLRCVPNNDTQKNKCKQINPCESRYYVTKLYMISYRIWNNILNVCKCKVSGITDMSECNIFYLSNFHHHLTRRQGCRFHLWLCNIPRCP